MKPVCITFAGPFGCSKSPVAQYLACEFGWPLLANDVIRNEVREDTMSAELDIPEYHKRLYARLEGLIVRGQSFVHDGSQDRRWEKVAPFFDDSPYRVGVISFDLSPEFYRKLIKTKHYPLTDEQIHGYLADHASFLEKHSDTIICRITNETFARRLPEALAATRRFIDAA
jgi:predicted kinase